MTAREFYLRVSNSISHSFAALTREMSRCQAEHDELVKVWENWKKPWKHSPAARVPTAFLVLPNFLSCFYLTIRL